MRKILIVSCLCLCLFVVSCKSQRITDFTELPIGEQISKAADDIDNTKTKLDDSISEIGYSSNAIFELISSLPASDELDEIEQIAAESKQITTETKVMRTEVGRLSDIRASLLVSAGLAEQAEIQAREIASERDELVARVDELEREQAEQAAALLRWIMVASVVAAGAAIALIAFGNMAIGSMLLAGSIGTLVLTVTITQYYEYIAISGLALLAAAIGFAIYSIYTRDKALKEVVKTAEVAKTSMKTKDKIELFGDDRRPGQTMLIQSKPTEKLVKRHRRKLKAHDRQS